MLYEFSDLKKTLLNEQGNDVKEVFETDLNQLIEFGDFFDNTSYVYELLPMEASKCHKNCSVFYKNYIKDHSEEEIDIVTGWALSEDNNWYQHSWIWFPFDDIITETTEIRKLYFGIVLEYKDLDNFLSEN